MSGDIVEKIRRVQNVVSEILEKRSVELIAARFRYETNLTARSCSELRRVIARFDAELLHVLETRLQTKWRIDLGIQRARIRINRTRPFDAVITDAVLFSGATGKANRAESA